LRRDQADPSRRKRSRQRPTGGHLADGTNTAALGSSVTTFPGRLLEFTKPSRARTSDAQRPRGVGMAGAMCSPVSDFRFRPSRRAGDRRCRQTPTTGTSWGRPSDCAGAPARCTTEGRPTRARPRSPKSWLDSVQGSCKARWAQTGFLERGNAPWNLPPRFRHILTAWWRRRAGKCEMEQMMGGRRRRFGSQWKPP